jgi:hypothetical protein
VGKHSRQRFNAYEQPFPTPCSKFFRQIFWGQMRAGSPQRDSISVENLLHGCVSSGGPLQN